MSTLTTIHICLTPELDRFVRDRVASGQYENLDDVVRDGLELLRQRENEQRDARHDLKAKLHRGAEQAQRGQLLDGVQVMRDVRARTAARPNRKAS